MILKLAYGDLNAAMGQSRKASDEIGRYCNDLKRKIINKINSVEGEPSQNLHDAEYYVKSKLKALEKKQSNLLRFASNVEKLTATAKRVDETVKRTIESKMTEFLNENPDLKAPLIQRAWISFICTLKGVSEVIGDFADESTTKIRSAHRVVCESIKVFWENNAEALKTILVITGIAVICILTGGTFAVIGLGLLAGTLSTLIGDVIKNLGKDVSQWRLSSAEQYIGAAVGSAATFLAGPAFGWTLAGAIGSGTTTLVSSLLELNSGKSDKSWIQIGVDTLISAWVGALVGSLLDSNFTKGLDKSFGAIMGRKAGIFTGRGSHIGSLRTTLTKLVKGQFHNITFKTFLSVSLIETAKKTSSTAEKHIKNFIIDFAIKPGIRSIEQGLNLPPIYHKGIRLPIQKSTYDLIMGGINLTNLLV